MDHIQDSKTRLKVLVCANLNIDSASRLVEKLVPQEPTIDLIIACGPFVDGLEPKSEEGEACDVADIATIVAQLENIVCRVLYLPSYRDPHRLLRDECHLTPNSLTIHGRKASLMPNLYICGYSEADLTEEVAAKVSEDEYLQDMILKSSQSIHVLKDVLALEKEGMTDTTSPITGIFALMYHYSHTLNTFLFHTNYELQRAGVRVCIVSSSNPQELSRLPRSLESMSLVNPGSLRDGNYTELIMDLDPDGYWKATSIERITF